MLSLQHTRHQLWSVLPMVFIVICVVAATMLNPGYAGAQSEPGLELRPAVLDVGAQINETVQTTVTVTNTSAEPLGIQVRPRSLVPEDEPIDSSAVDRYDASQWVTLPEDSFLIEGFKSVDVPVNVTVPENAVPGGHYTLVVFRIINDSTPDATGVQVNREAGSVLLISVPGEVTEQAFVRTDSAPSVVLGGVLEITQTVLNQGNSHIVPIITTDIKDSDGMVVETITQPPQLLLPNTQRTLDIRWEPTASIGVFTAETTLAFGSPGQSTGDGSHRFYVMPSGPTMVLWMAGIFGAGWLIFSIVRRQKGRKKSEE